MHILSLHYIHICILVYSRPWSMHIIITLTYIHTFTYVHTFAYSSTLDHAYYHSITYICTFAYSSTLDHAYIIITLHMCIHLHTIITCVVLCCVISRVTLHGFFYMPPSLLVARISYQSHGLRPSHETFQTPLFTHASSWISLAAFSRRELYRVEWWAMCVCQVKPLKCKVFYQ